ncbi:unnamed protein product [Prorocentrum cordatum]|uniref:Uncharacterized protein n=1 Tax=Prorocentrum cordatum TaxID=2364126 RepID=A0ABN9SNS4_9DINO|nr:unnamed protein product [Polarella glacialis]
MSEDDSAREFEPDDVKGAKAELKHIKTTLASVEGVVQTDVTVSRVAAAASNSASPSSSSGAPRLIESWLARKPG